MTEGIVGKLEEILMQGPITRDDEMVSNIPQIIYQSDTRHAVRVVGRG